MKKMKRYATLSTVLMVVLSILLSSCGPAASTPPVPNTTESAVPAVVFYIFAERQIVSGLTAGALKG